MDEVTAFAPASISNLGPGFDILGLALDHAGDTVIARRAGAPGVRIAAIEGAPRLRRLAAPDVPA